MHLHDIFAFYLPKFLLIEGKREQINFEANFTRKKTRESSNSQTHFEMSINSSYSATANPVVVDTVQEHVVDTHGKTIIQQYHYHYYNTDPADENTQPKSQPDAIPSVQPTPALANKTQPIPKMAQSRFLTPAQVIDKLKLDGVRKSKLTLDQTIILSLFAGVFKGIAGSISMLIGGNNPEMQKNNPGAQQLMFGM